jgi:hypothetical protein
MDLNERPPARHGLNLKQKMVVILMDILLIAELTYSIYLGSQHQEYMASIFLRNFLPMVLVTIISARIFIKAFRTKDLVFATEDHGKKRSLQTSSEVE